MATTTNFDWETPDDTDLVKDGAAAIRTLGSNIDTSMADLLGGTTGQILSKTSATDMDFTWLTPAGAGKVLQVVQGTLAGQTNTSSTSYADTGLTVDITPSATSSKVLIIASIQGIYKNGGATGTGLGLKLLRGATSINYFAERAAYTNTDLRNNVGGATSVYLDSPATTSATTYKVQFASYVSGQISAINEAPAGSIVSTITAIEIGA